MVISTIWTVERYYQDSILSKKKKSVLCTIFCCEPKTILKAVNNLSYPTSILYLEADINYTIFHLSDGRKIVSSFTLKKHEQKHELGTFLRVNKSYLLNPDFIKICQKKGKKTSIELSNGKIMQVSRRKVGLVKGLIMA